MVALDYIGSKIARSEPPTVLTNQGLAGCSVRSETGCGDVLSCSWSAGGVQVPRIRGCLGIFTSALVLKERAPPSLARLVTSASRKDRSRHAPS